jgi:hypothetical protein
LTLPIALLALLCNPPRFSGIAIGVGQPANTAAPSKSIPPACFSVDFVFGPPLGVFGVGQPANIAACPRFIPKPFPFPCFSFKASRRSIHVVSPSFCGPAFGVGHPENPLADVRRADDDSLCLDLIPTHNPSFAFLSSACSRQIPGPKGIATYFQRSAYSGEPVKGIVACNLLSSANCGAAL